MRIGSRNGSGMAKVITNTATTWGLGKRQVRVVQHLMSFRVTEKTHFHRLSSVDRYLRMCSLTWCDDAVGPLEHLFRGAPRTYLDTMKAECVRGTPTTLAFLSQISLGSKHFLRERAYHGGTRELEGALPCIGTEMDMGWTAAVFS